MAKPKGRRQQITRSSIHKAKEHEVETIRLINAALDQQPVTPLPPVYYYQGLHDVASVLLMVVGERDASPLLAVLASVHLRDCTRPSIDAVLELLGMLFPILAAVDPQLAQHLQDADLMPYFALSWFITWFSHGQRLLQDAARLFDLFLSSHPLMPLYVGAAAMHNARAQLLRLREMPELHTFLVNLDLGQGPALDQLARQAISLIKLSPPLPLAQRHLHHLSLASAVAPAAALSDVAGAWGVPEHPPEGGKGGLLASTALSLTGIVGVYLVAAVVMTYGSGRSGQQGLFEAGGRSLWPGLGLFLQL
ncbi:MAG: hypothetical protein WDW36_005929 [Sanguina aurantia]